ncbi:MAG: XrtA/PEP-CTERM system histidine kinase PrsK, partial [Desulfuromonadaceae bacterium]
FDLLSLVISSNAFFWKDCALHAESFLSVFWILCSLTYARKTGPWKIGVVLKLVVASSLLLAVLPQILPQSAFFYAPDFPDERVIFLGNAGFFFYIAIMACLVFALVNFENTLANASSDTLWGVKFEVVGLGTILTVQLFYFSQALLYRSLNMNYLPLRSFMYLVAAALMAYSFAYYRSKVRIQISRQVAFKSFVLSAVGLYLILLGLMGEGMQYSDIHFPRAVTALVAFLLGLALLLLLLSERFRREVKVSLHKNFFQNKHDYRTQWLRFTEQLSSSRTGAELLQHILSEYCDIFGITGSALYLFEENRSCYCVLAEHVMELHDEVISANNSLIGFMAARAWVVSIAEANIEIAAEDVRFFRENHISFVVPLFGNDRLEGFIVLGQPVDNKEVYIYEDFDLMKTIASQASMAILHQRLSEQITQAREIEVIGNVATFVVHDLKNLVSNLSLIVENSTRHIHNPDFQGDMLMSLGNTVEKMQKLIKKLKNLGKPGSINKQPVDVLDLAERTAQLVVGNVIIVSGTAEIVCMDESEIQKVILNLIMNAIEASGPQKPVEVEVGRSAVPFVRVIDRGCGMPAHFIRSELFKPFKTTKSQGLGIGLYQCRKVVEAHGGRIEVNSQEGKGSVFTVWFAGS